MIEIVDALDLFLYRLEFWEQNIVGLFGLCLGWFGRGWSFKLGLEK